ncbi:glycine receptor subunit alpha-4 [Procambarus clarkii]|uniref:glycine receptor subunit alpha-4 n=1 Tax=Procambarus clarkii TaxID=6728 RepID=UPI003743EA7A
MDSLLLKEPCDYNGMLRICKGFGGHFPTEEEVASGGLEVANSVASHCITDETQVSWVGSKGRYGEGLTTLCPTLLTNGTLGSRTCLSELECSVCRVPATLRFTLFGDIHDFDRYYFLRIMPDGNIYFKGQETCNITRNDNKWILRSRLHRREWQLQRGSQPVGRHRWCSGDENTTLTLTSCNILQFSSHDGVCLPRSQRCDGNKDSPDGSDEEGCRKRLVDKEPGYEREVTPVYDSNDQGIVTYSYEIFNIDQITNEKGMAHLDIGFFMSWHDPRVRFWDLGENLHFISCDEIWYPKLGMFAGYKQGPGINVECYSSRCNTRKNMNSIEQYDFKDAFMGRFLTGQQQSLRVYSECRVSFPCKFHLHRFPFGSQMCNGSFYIVKAITEMKWQHKDNATGPYEVNYENEDYLLDYRLIKITGETTVDFHWSGRQKTFAIITLHLQSLCDYHLLNSFAPSALMFIISYSTLFFPIKEFNERIMVSLTSLLVLTGLFAQATNSYVKTPYYKLLDIWYAILITLCFCIVIANVVVNMARVSRIQTTSSVHDNENDDDALILRKPKRFNFLSLSLFLFLFLLLVVIYVCFALDVL